MGNRNKSVIKNIDSNSKPIVFRDYKSMTDLIKRTKATGSTKVKMAKFFHKYGLVGDGNDGGKGGTVKKLHSTKNIPLFPQSEKIKNIHKRTPKEIKKEMAEASIVRTARDNASKGQKRTRIPKLAAGSVNAGIKDKINTNAASAEGIGVGLGSGTNPGSFTIPVTYKSSRASAQTLVNRGDNGKVFKSVYETGFRPSKALLLLAKQKGVEVKTMFDTKIDFTTSVLRNALTHGSGFNIKEYHVPCGRAQMSYNDVRNNIIGVNLNNVADMLSSDERTLASVLNLKQQFMIRNNSAGFPMEFKIHIVKPNYTSFASTSMSRLFFDIVPSPTEFAATTGIRGKIPRWFMLDGYSQENTGDDKTLSLQFRTSNKVKDLGISSTFRQLFDVVETFQKTLDPNDYWNFTHIHNCGAGIDMNILSTFGSGGPAGTEAIGQDNSLAQSPYLYGVIFECKGKACEAAFVNATGTEFDTYIGTSPTFYSYECKTTANVIRDDNFFDRVHIRRQRLRPTSVINDSVDALTDLKEIRGNRQLFDFAPPALTLGNAGRYHIPYESPTLITGRGTSFATDPG